MGYACLLVKAVIQTIQPPPPHIERLCLYMLNGTQLIATSITSFCLSKQTRIVENEKQPIQVHGAIFLKCFFFLLQIDS